MLTDACIAQTVLVLCLANHGSDLIIRQTVIVISAHNYVTTIC